MRSVLITGAASGLGWEMAQRCYERGDRVILLDMNETLLAERQAALRDAERVWVYALDLCDDSARAQCVAELQQRLSQLDVLINNAGITHRSMASRTDTAVFKKVMAVDWIAPVELTMALLPLIKACNGSVVGIGSMAGWMPVPGRAAYCSAKSALAQFFEVLRAEESASGLHVFMVYPSFLDTPIEQNALGGDGQKAKHARSTIGRIDDAGQLAERILKGVEDRRPWLFPNRFTWFASIIWRIAPAWFHRNVQKRFAVEMEQHA